jgi:hypothetical protein
MTGTYDEAINVAQVTQRMNIWKQQSMNYIELALKAQLHVKETEEIMRQRDEKSIYQTHQMTRTFERLVITTSDSITFKMEFKPDRKRQNTIPHQNG